MKTIRVLVLLLLASVHVFTPVSSNESVEKKEPASPAPKLSTTLAASAKAPIATPTPTAAPTAAAPTASTTAAPTKLIHVPSTAPRNATSKTPETKKPEVSTPAPKKTASSAASADHKTVTPTSVVVVRTDDETVKNDSLHPRSPHPGNHSAIEATETRGSIESTEKPKPGKGTTSRAPVPGRPTALHLTTPPQGTPPHPNKKDKDKKDAGSQAGSDEKVPPKSDKRLWWIVLPALLVAAAAAIVLKFKCKKIHDHTETIDTGTENASFQSRPESTKDGVMLLGVKPSGGEENAAAR